MTEEKSFDTVDVVEIQQNVITTEEQESFVYSEEQGLDETNIVDIQKDVTVKETVETIDVSEIEVFTIDASEAFAALGESNKQLKHTLLNGRELPDQHPIMAITGLRDELNEIESLKTVYSNNKNYANYYMWQDENPLQENREGFFVSLCPTTNKIKICDFNEDTGEVSEVFGVTVNSAGFIGGQDDVARDNKYGLVVCSGMATVRCASNVAVGDYVVPNRYGVAEKAVCSVVNNTGTTIEVDGKCGYLVVALDDTSGTSCAEIIFNVSAKQLNNLENSIHEFNVRIDNTETNITSAINVANEAYYLASNLGDIGKLNTDTIEKVNDALEKAEQALEETVSQSEQIAMAKKTSEEAKAIAQLTSASAEAIRSEAVATANDALAKTNDLIDSLEPITTWTDEDGNTGATYLAEYIDNGLATKTEVETVSTMTEELKLRVDKNASGVEAMVSSVATYSLGEFSQSYGLTQVQARAILEKDLIYVPTVDHTEEFVTAVGTIDKIFTKGYYYTWNGINNWIASDSPYVAFSSQYVVGNNTTVRFWVVDSEEPIEYNGIIYEPDTLHMWQENRWVVVADLASNPSNRIANTLRYTTNSLAAEITNARGSAATLGIRLTDTESEIQTLASWKSDVENDVANIATIKQTADDAGASIAQVVQSIGSDGVVNVASIVTAINDSGDSSITLNADHINVDGAFTTNGNAGFTVDGNLFAKGGEIAGWDINSDYLGKMGGTDSAFFLSQGGRKAWVSGAPDLNDDAKQNRDCLVYFTGKFAVDTSGNLYSSAGYIGGWEINSDYLGYYTTSGSGTNEFFLSRGGKSVYVPAAGSSVKCLCNFGGQFAVDNTGKLYANQAKISGEITATSGSFSDSVTIGETKVTAGYLSNLYNYATGGTGTGTAITQIDASMGHIGGFDIDETSIRNNRPAFTNNTGANKNGIYITKSGDSNGYGGISLGSYNSNSGIYYDQYVYAGRHVITGYGGTAYAQTSLKYNGMSFNYSTSDDLNINSDDTKQVGSIATYSNRVQLEGTWWGKSSSVINSDINKKNTISSIDEKYVNFFDGLESYTYKYNDGTSDRLHTGFVAQQVKQALDEADINTSEFAGLVIQKDPDGEEHWGVRYEEFIALNTWQIQQLKKRVAELEAKLEQKEK